MKVGVLALQGAFREHENALKACGAETRQVRLPAQLEGLDALVIPGGESTTMGKLMIQYGLLQPIKDFAQAEKPIFGTCAGLIMLSKKIIGTDQPALELMDTVVERNAFGRQVESFEEKICVPVLGEEPFPAVFIRAPYIDSVTGNTEVLSRYGEKIILAKQNHLLACAFHPELTKDLRLHQYFLKMIKA